MPGDLTQVSAPAGVAVVDAFRGPAAGFLSNFFIHPFMWDGVTADTAEHHFAAAKTVDPEAKRCVYEQGSPAAAKRVGRQVLLREGWDEHGRYEAMWSILAAKFAVPMLRDQLVRTGDALLVEGNDWHDQVFGDCSCRWHATHVGANVLGRMLMRLRGDLSGATAARRWPRVAVTGHRPHHLSATQRAWVQGELGRVVTRLHEQHGARVFMTGMAVGVDQWFGDHALRRGGALWAYMPFPDQAAQWGVEDKARWDRLRGASARQVTVGDRHRTNYYFERNRLLVRDADAVVAVCRGSLRDSRSGSGHTLRQALTFGVPVILIDPDTTTTRLLNGVGHG